MPTAAPKPCMICRALVHDGTTRCAAHKRPAGSFADRTRGSRQARGYGAAWDRARRLVLARDGGICRCADCTRLGRVLVATEVDHVVPKARGGSDDPDNLQAINRDCHASKTAREALAARGIEARVTDHGSPTARGEGG